MIPVFTYYCHSKGLKKEEQETIFIAPACLPPVSIPFFEGAFSCVGGASMEQTSISVDNGENVSSSTLYAF